MTPEELAIRRMRDYKYHVEKCEANNLSPMDWPTYKYLYGAWVGCPDSKDTAEENHQRVEELMFKHNLRNMKRKIL
jgi:hypothetical protein